MDSQHGLLLTVIGGIALVYAILHNIYHRAAISRWVASQGLLCTVLTAPMLAAQPSCPRDVGMDELESTLTHLTVSTKLMRQLSGTYPSEGEDTRRYQLTPLGYEIVQDLQGASLTEWLKWVG